MKYQEILENSRKYLEISGNTLKYQEIPRKIVIFLSRVLPHACSIHGVTRPAKNRTYHFQETRSIHGVY
jgi:hypothetical protein